MTASYTHIVDDIASHSPDTALPEFKEPYEIKIDEAEDALKNLPLNRNVSEEDGVTDKLRSMDDTVSSLQSEDSQKVAKVALDSAERIAERSERLLGYLDHAASIHPFITVAVIAFKVAMKLELTRRENDQRILGLHNQMCSVMETVVCVRGFASRRDEGGPADGLLKVGIKDLADDICSCAEMCDTFQKTTFFNRLLRSQEWNASFRHYFDAFDNHRHNLHEAITIWCGEAIQKLVKETVPPDPSLTRIRAYFDSSVEDHSGAFPPPKSRINGPDDQAPDLSQEMWDETDGDSVGNLVLSNAVIFQKKFALQENSIARRSQNRAVDTSLTIMFEKMKWKGRQRADVVVVELVKNFCGHCQAVTKQPLIEAIDVDGSSFITIEELDAFIKMAPKDWKSRRWLEYWLIASPLALRQSYDRIDRLLGTIVAKSLNIRPGNRAHIQRLLGEGVFLTTDYLLSGVYDSVQGRDAVPVDDTFSVYDDAEETRIRHTLEDLKYNLDAPNTVALVIEPGNIEKGVLIILYLLLRRCLELIEAAHSTHIEKKDMLYLRQSFWALLRFIYDRVDAICNMNVDGQTSHRERLKTFGFGMYQYTFHRKEIGNSSYMTRCLGEGDISTPGTKYVPLEGGNQNIPEALLRKITSVLQDSNHTMHTFISLCAAQGVSDIQGRRSEKKFEDMLKQAFQRATRNTSDGRREDIPRPKARDDQPHSAPSSRPSSIVAGSGEWNVQDPVTPASNLSQGFSSGELAEYCWFVDLIVRRQVVHSPVQCDGCRAPTLIMTRILCLGCFTRDKSRTVDFCAKCIRRSDSMCCQRSGPNDAHPLLQLRQFTYNKWGNNHTKRALEVLREGNLYPRLGGSPVSTSPRKCVSCDCALKRPFWNCLDCLSADIYVCCHCNDAAENQLNTLVLEDILPTHRDAGSRTSHHWSHTLVLMMTPLSPSHPSRPRVPSFHQSLLEPPRRPLAHIRPSIGELVFGTISSSSASEDHASSAPSTPSTPGSPPAASGPSSTARPSLRIPDMNSNSNLSSTELSSISHHVRASRFSPVRPSPLRSTTDRRKSLPTSLSSEEDTTTVLGLHFLPREPPNLGSSYSPETPVQSAAAPAAAFHSSHLPSFHAPHQGDTGGSSSLEARVASLEATVRDSLSGQIAEHTSRLENAYETISSHLLRLERLTTSLNSGSRASPSPPYREDPYKATHPDISLPHPNVLLGDTDKTIGERLSSVEARLEQVSRTHWDSSLSTTASTSQIPFPGTSETSGPSQEDRARYSYQLDTVPNGAVAAAGGSMSASRSRFLRRLIPMSFHKRSASTGVIRDRAEMPGLAHA